MKDDVRINLNAEVMRCRDQAGPTRRSIQGMGGARMQQTANKKGTSKRWRYVFTPTLAGLRWPVQPGVGHWPPPRKRKRKNKRRRLRQHSKSNSDNQSPRTKWQGRRSPASCRPGASPLTRARIATQKRRYTYTPRAGSSSPRRGPTQPATSATRNQPPAGAQQARRRSQRCRPRRG